MATEKKEPEQVEEREIDIIEEFVDFGEYISDKYNLDEGDRAKWREIVFGLENARNAEPMYDKDAVEMVEMEEEGGEEAYDEED